MRRNITAQYDEVVVLYTTTKMTLDQIADKYGVTREAIRQIVLKKIGPNYRSSRPAEPTASVEEVAAAYLEKGNRGLRGAVRKTWDSMTTEQRRHLVRRRRPRMDRAKIFSKAMIIKTLQKAANKLGPSFTSSQYVALARKNNWPSAATIINIMTSWNSAKKAAGLPPGVSARKIYTRITPDECLIAIATVTKAIGHGPTVGEYNAYRGTPLPCVTTVRKRCQEYFGASWRQAVELSMSYIDKVPTPTGKPIGYLQVSQVDQTRLLR